MSRLLLTTLALLLPTTLPAQLAQTQLIDGEIRIHVNAPPVDERPCRVMLYATPNGNTLEQTLGRRVEAGGDWRLGIQQVAAQVEWLRRKFPQERVVLVVAEARGLSWPAYRARHADANERIRRLVEAWRVRFGSATARMTLTGHSGGGSFIFGAIEGGADIPPDIDCIAPLDANYAFEAKLHGDKLHRWLTGDAGRRLIVVAYDDREILYEGKKVVGPEGGTFRATDRMATALEGKIALAKKQAGEFTVRTGLEGRVRLVVHRNPQNKILHTALVGDMNGLIFAQSTGAGDPLDAVPQSPPIYTEHIPAEPLSAHSTEWSAAELRELTLPPLPPRSATARGGREICNQLAELPLTEREAELERELLAGNLPNFLRRFCRVTLPSGVVIGVAPDWLAVGSDDDFVRMPLTPQTAQRIATAWGCLLPTPLMVDAIDLAAEAQVTPLPFGEPREAVSTFVASSAAIDTARGKESRGLLLTGGKKDVVLSALLCERPNRVAIYGWRQLDGTPIQPLTTVHVNTYVDYSHGIRLVADSALWKGERVSLAELLTDPSRCKLISNEGVVDPP